MMNVGARTAFEVSICSARAGCRLDDIAYQSWSRHVRVPLIGR
jgi:hypothetical protein